MANLLLAAGLARKRELAIRLALGAGRGQLARLLLTESLLLAGSQLPRSAAIHVDVRVLAFALIMSAGVGVFCGLWPLLRMKLGEIASSVREGDTRTVTDARSSFGNGLVVAEIALAFGLLVGAGLLIKNLSLLQSRDAGIRAEGAIAFDVAPAGPRYASGAQLVEFYRSLYDRLRTLPGVTSVGFTSHLPMKSYGMNAEMKIEGTMPWGPNEAPLVEYRFILGDLFKSLGITTTRGRTLDARDGSGTRTVMINEAMAGKFWPGQNPIGKRFGQGDDVSQWWEVVGVIADVRSFGLAAKTPYEFYQTTEQSPYRTLTAVLHASSPGQASALIPAARQIVRTLDPSIPITSVQTMEDVVASSVGQPRLITALSSLFGATAGLLALVGVYGVMAYNVRRQRQEFGIRLALGARQSDVLQIVLGRGLKLAAAGIGLGLFAAFGFSRLVATMLNDVKPTDPLVFASLTAIVFAVCGLACLIPARQASQVDPLVVLRDT